MTTCINKGEYIYVEVNEPYSLKLLLSAIHEVADHCQTDHLDKVLIDLRKMAGNPTIFDRFQLGIEIARTWGSRIRAAAITSLPVMSRIGENAAVNRGATLLITTTMDAAMKWLEVKFHEEKIGDQP